MSVNNEPVKGKIVKLKDDDQTSTLFPVTSTYAVQRTDSSTLEETLMKSVKHEEYTDEIMEIKYPNVHERIDVLEDKVDVIIDVYEDPNGNVNAQYIGQRYKCVTGKELYIAYDTGINSWQIISNSTLKKEDLPYVTIEMFGGIGDGIADDTKAFQQAIDFCGVKTNNVKVIRLHSKKYMCNNLIWNDGPSIMGSEVGFSVIIYNGEDGGSLFINTKNNGYTPFSGFYNIQFIGYNETPGSTTGIANSAYVSTNSCGPDWGFKIENCQFMKFKGTVIDFSMSDIINLHMNRIRFDYNFGKAIHLRGSQSSENRPVSINQVSYDNAISTKNLMYHKLVSLGLIDENNPNTVFGEGFLLITNGKGLSINLSNSRFEVNSVIKEIGGQASIIHCMGDLGPLSLSLDNCVGFTKNTLQNTSGVFAENYRRVNLSIKNSSLGCSKLYECGDLKKDLPNYIRDAFIKGNAQQDQGGIYNGTRIEFRTSKPDGTVFNQYRKGDLIINSNNEIGKPIGWVCVSPSIGFARPSSNIIINASDFKFIDNRTIEISNGKLNTHIITGLNIKLNYDDGSIINTMITRIEQNFIHFNSDINIEKNITSITPLQPEWEVIGYTNATILESPNGTKYKLKVNDDGTVTSQKV